MSTAVRDAISAPPSDERDREPAPAPPAVTPAADEPAAEVKAVSCIAPRQRDATATRARLLDAAEAQFAAHGFAGSRVDEIARAAGINVQLIYRYFGDKSGLHQAVFDRLFLQAARSLEQAVCSLPPDTPPKERFTREIGSYFDFVWTHPNFASFSLWSLAEGIVPGFGGPGEGLQAMTRVAEQALAESIAAGVIRPGVTGELMGGMLVSLCVAQFKCLSGHCGSGADLDPLDPAVRDRLRRLVTDAILGAFGA
jgi:AcrR family transcriptional regulator